MNIHEWLQNIQTQFFFKSNFDYVLIERLVLMTNCKIYFHDHIFFLNNNY